MERKGSRLLLVNCSQVLTMTGADLGIVEQGAVRVRDGLITEVGTGLKREGDELVIDARQAVVLPGFVDPHTHLVFAGWRADEFELRLSGKSYKEIAEAGGGILSTVKATREASEDELYTRALERTREMLAWGTTAVEVKSGYGLDTGNEIKILRVAKRLGDTAPLRVVPTFLGAHSVPRGMEKADYIRLVVEEMMPAVARDGLAQFVDVFCENFVFNGQESEEILRAGQRLGLLATIHADEIESSGGAEVAARVGAISASHLVFPSAEGLKGMAERGVCAVLLPGTGFFLQEKNRPPVEEMRRLGITIALGSDFNPGSCTLLAQPLTAQLGCLHYGLTIVEALRAVTINAAKALRLDGVVGSLEPGKRADIVVTDVPEYRQLIYRLGHNPVRMVLIEGRVVYQSPSSGSG